MMNPDLIRRISDLFVGCTEINIVIVRPKPAGDLARPPTIVVEGINCLVERELAVGIYLWKGRLDVLQEERFG
ncbi:hypothetical protein AHAS_Ahas15G0172200 [Arachis hypogaea]